MKKIALLLAVFIGTLSTAVSQMIIPQPNEIKLGVGKVRIDSATDIYAPKGAEAVRSYIRSVLSPATGYPFPDQRSAKRAAISLLLVKDSALGEEGYRLVVQNGQIQMSAQNERGLFYGVQSLRQLLPVEIYSPTKVQKDLWELPEVEISDVPRFSWRGAHMDVGRHFMPKEFVFKFLDLMALHKLNTFHFHLTDDQGWRIEIKKYPKLTEVGAWRKDTMLVYDPPKYTGKPHGGFYTQAELKEIVKYAASRYITVVPEIEMPGHAQAAIAAYPELGNGQPGIEVLTKWGVSENVFNVKDSTIDFLKDVLTEVMAIFPSKFIHVGGDECPKKQWEQSAFAQAKIKKLGLKNEHELQSWFIRQMDAFLDSKNRRLIGWSEILEGGLAPGAALMVWLGNEGAMQAVSSGHDVVMAQTSHTYFDYYQSRDRANEPHSIGGYLPLEKVYEYNPVLPTMTAEQSKHVLGAQFQLWSEYIHTPAHMEYMAFPRGCALSEVAWTQRANMKYEDFLTRMKVHEARLKLLNVNSKKL